jgi:hypothetical protein
MFDGGQMTVEEQLLKLTERCGALAQSAELLAGMQVETEKRMARLVEVTNNIGSATTELIHMAHDHEDRITSLEEA